MERPANFCPNCGHTLEMQPRDSGKLRPVCARCGFVMYFDPKVAVIAVVLEDDKLLMIQRKHDPGKDLWALPAGFVEADEDPAAAAARETLEETGMIVQIEHLIEVFPKQNDGGLAEIAIAYRARLIGGTLYADDDAAAVGWFGLDALPPTVFNTTTMLITRWREGRL